MSTEYWIIKRDFLSPHGGPKQDQYWTGLDILKFSEDIMKAVRFADIRSAHAVAQGTLKGVAPAVLHVHRRR